MSILCDYCLLTSKLPYYISAYPALSPATHTRTQCTQCTQCTHYDTPYRSCGRLLPEPALLGKQQRGGRGTAAVRVPVARGHVPHRGTTQGIVVILIFLFILFCFVFVAFLSMKNMNATIQ
jgi:hypothetical protein